MKRGEKLVKDYDELVIGEGGVGVEGVDEKRGQIKGWNCTNLNFLRISLKTLVLSSYNDSIFSVRAAKDIVSICQSLVLDY